MENAVMSRLAGRYPFLSIGSRTALFPGEVQLSVFDERKDRAEKIWN